MRLLPSDPDVATIVARIRSGDINLQPEFQRGEVWSKLKKQRLVDSILRDWHVPPIHVIENAQSRKQEVLDGQQRLAAIRDFVDGLFPIDGQVEPIDSGIQALGGRHYRQLSDEWRRRFDQFTIRVFRIVDYRSSEPAELFFRLNQPTSLTGAEQRNAFFGPVREQIRNLVTDLERESVNRAVLGFSNSRMAYDDVLSRTALAIHRRTIAEKITSADLTQLYRADEPLSQATIDTLTNATFNLATGIKEDSSSAPKFNKATLFSWLIFLVRMELSNYTIPSPIDVGHFVAEFNRIRYDVARDFENVQYILGSISANRLFSIYENRSTARVADVSSVVLRDAIIWFFALNMGMGTPALPLPQLGILNDAFSSSNLTLEDDAIARQLVDNGWGRLG